MESDIKKKHGNTLMKPRTKSIGEFLSDTQLIVIPPNQRPYAWEEKQVNEFLSDLNYTREQKNNLENEYWHYFNMVTYVRDETNPKNIYIHDGQQRLTTTFITLFYLLSKYKHKTKNLNINGMSNNMKKFEENLYVNDERKLHMFSQNDELVELLYCKFDKGEAFDIKILESELEEKKLLIASNNRIINLLKEIEKSSYTKEYIEDSQGISQLFEALFVNFEIVLGELGNSHQAYKIFELVNNRGKSLSQIDLIKNHFYQIADKSGNNTDLTELEDKLSLIIRTLGDNFEDAIIKHWLLYFNKSENTLHGKPHDIQTSILVRLNGCNSISDERDVMFAFLDDIVLNLNYIETIYEIFELDYAKICNPDTVTYFEEKEFDVEKLRRIVVQRAFANAEFDYLDYYLYYLLFEYQKQNCSRRFKILTEYRKAVNFYVYRSHVKDGKINLDKLNYRIGQRLENMKKLGLINLNQIFVNFLLEETEGEHANYKLLLKEKLAAPHQEMKTTKTRLLYQICYGLENTDIFYEESAGKFDVVEVEHILPKSADRKDFESYDAFNLSSKDSLYKNKIDWIGNKLLLSKSKNNEVSDSFEKKLTEYSFNSDYWLNQKYFVILVKEFIDVNITKESILNQKRTDYIKQIVKMVSNNSEIENEKIMNSVEEKWRMELSLYIFEEDIFNLDCWNEIK